MKKPTKKERAEAIYWLDVFAGTRNLLEPGETMYLKDYSELAAAAFWEAPMDPYDPEWGSVYAEAAGLLRDGWSPGEEVPS